MLAARNPFNDLGSLKFGHCPEHGQRELVLWIFDVVLAVDNELFPVLQNLFDDDRLDRNLAGNASLPDADQRLLPNGRPAMSSRSGRVHGTARSHPATVGTSSSPTP
jgi:hypothetical protein